jgi:hypothetical protein
MHRRICYPSTSRLQLYRVTARYLATAGYFRAITSRRARREFGASVSSRFSRTMKLLHSYCGLTFESRMSDISAEMGAVTKERHAADSEHQQLHFRVRYFRLSDTTAAVDACLQIFSCNYCIRRETTDLKLHPWQPSRRVGSHVRINGFEEPRGEKKSREIDWPLCYDATQGR